MNRKTVRTALVTGANRGIGFEVCRQLADAGLDVVLTARDAGAGVVAADKLSGGGHQIRAEQLDVTSRRSVADCAARLAADGVEIDVLVNNAGNYPTQSFFSVSEEVFAGSLDIHLMGAFRTCQEFVPAMRRRGYGRVVNVSSGYGAVSDGVPGPPAYGIAKAGLNALTQVLAREARPVKVNAVCPGWVRTDMGGRGASSSVAQGADTVTWLALLPDNGPTGGFFRARKQIPW